MSLPIFHTNIFLFIAFASQIFYAEFISSESKYYDKVKSWCSGAEFDVDSPYKTKLIQLLNSLPSSAGKSINNGYFATNKSSDSETIYARFLCRGDTTPDTCQGCVSTAISDLPLAKCLSDKSAVIWYGECMVQYSNKSFQGIVDEYIHEGWRNIDHVSSITDDVNGFMTLAGDTIQNLTSKVNSLGDHTREGDSKYYLIKDVAFNSFIRIYTMVQCTPDLNPLDCGRCLNIVVNEMATYCNGYKGGRVLNPSCYARYETYPYASTAPDLRVC
ncbi:Cysteine-rich receptor-like protein kinase 25 [Bienertia sinuspersici]